MTRLDIGLFENFQLNFNLAGRVLNLPPSIMLSMKTRTNRTLSLAALIATIAMSAGEAQTDTGAISGLVVDPSGAPIWGALVTAVHADTQAKFATRSDDSGFYACTTLRSGDYVL